MVIFVAGADGRACTGYLLGVGHTDKTVLESRPITGLTHLIAGCAALRGHREKLLLWAGGDLLTSHSCGLLIVASLTATVNHVRV